MRYSRIDLFFIALNMLFAGVGVVAYITEGELLGPTIFFGIGALILIAAPWIRRYRMSRPERVTFDEQRVERHMPNGTVESIAWDEIHEVGIMTTAEGPFVDDVFWLLTNRERTKGCAPSNAAEGFSALLERLQQLPGFDNEAVIRAMGSTEEQYFIIWRREER